MLMVITGCFQQVTEVEAVSSYNTLPLYWAWFLQQDDSSIFLNMSHKLLNDSLLEVPEFFSDVKEFTNQTTTEEIIGYYSQSDPYSHGLHCTAMFNGFYPNYTDGAEEYAARPEVEVI